jgi:DNA-binding CsgD family transcriptional regulator/tetratricopeptide (TPR) repeat protein
MWAPSPSTRHLVRLNSAESIMDGAQVTVDGTMPWPLSGSDPSLFVGRDPQLREIVAASRTLSRGGATVFLIEGEAGAGKTTLVEHCVAQTAGLPAIRVDCRPVDATTRYGALRGLLGDLAASTGDVGAELWRRFGDGPTARVVVIENVHWLDPASAVALRSAIRGMRSEPVLVLLTTQGIDAADSSVRWALRELERAVLELPLARHLHLDGLTAGNIQVLASRVGIGQLRSAAAKRIRVHTGGNPAQVRAFLTELPAEAFSALDRPLPVPDSLISEMDGVIGQLPAPSRQLAGTLAVLDAIVPLSVAARAAGLDDGVAALEPLLVRRIVRWWPNDPVTPIGIRTPQQRNAIYAALTPGDRRALHEAVAASVAGIDTWRHRMAAAVGPNGDLAAGLAKAARDEFVRGDPRRAAVLLQWAADLTADVSRAERRSFTAMAYLLSTAGAAIRGEGLAGQLETCPLRLLRDLAFGLAAYHEGRLAVAESLLLRVLSLAEQEPDVDLIGVHVALALGSLYALQDRADEEYELALRIAVLSPSQPAAQRYSNWYLADAAGRHGVGATEALRQLARLEPPDHVLSQRPTAWARGIWQVLSGRFTAAIEDLQPALRLLGTSGADPLAVAAATYLAVAQYNIGAWDTANTTVESVLTAAPVGQLGWPLPPVHALACALAAARGEWDRARDELGEVDRLVRVSSLPGHALHRAFAAASIAQAEANYPAMLGALNDIAEQQDRVGEVAYHQLWWRPMHVEALLGTRQLAAAGRALVGLARFAEDVPPLRVAVAWLTGWHAQLNGDLGAARSRYEEALEWPAGPDDLPLYRARLEQGYGSLLLAQQNQHAAAEALRRARDGYAQVRAHPYLERCDELLRACGSESGPAGRGSLAALSRHEFRVAHLVGSGLTNKEAAQELFVSPKTVEYHLGNIYAKLGITSRRELRTLARPDAAD